MHNREIDVRDGVLHGGTGPGGGPRRPICLLLPPDRVSSEQPCPRHRGPHLKVSLVSSSVKPLVCRAAGARPLPVGVSAQRPVWSCRTATSRGSSACGRGRKSGAKTRKKPSTEGTASGVSRRRSQWPRTGGRRGSASPSGSAPSRGRCRHPILFRRPTERIRTALSTADGCCSQRFARTASREVHSKGKARGGRKARPARSEGGPPSRRTVGPRPGATGHTTCIGYRCAPAAPESPGAPRCYGSHSAGRLRLRLCRRRSGRLSSGRRLGPWKERVCLGRGKCGKGPALAVGGLCGESVQRAAHKRAGSM